jgi:hypothetical protein
MTLGDWRDRCARLFGETSASVRWFDGKIKTQGRDEEVLADESQVLYAVWQIEVKDWVGNGPQAWPPE